MKKYKEKIALIGGVSIVFMLFCTLGICQEPAPASQKAPFMQWLKDRLKITASGYQEYDDNIFLDQKSHWHDWKTGTVPSFDFLHRVDKGFINLTSTTEAIRYSRSSKNYVSQAVMGRTSYDFTPYLTLGFRNSYVYSREIKTSFHDNTQFIRLGYNFNAFSPSALVKITKTDRVRFVYAWIHTNFLDSAIDDPIDSSAHNFDWTYEHDVNKWFTGYNTWAVHDMAYLSGLFHEKNYTQYNGLLGGIIKIPMVAKIDFRGGMAFRDFKVNKNSTEAIGSINVSSMFSRKTSLGTYIDYSLGDSTRRDYREYIAIAYGFFANHRIDDWTLYGNVSAYIRKYAPKDLIPPYDTSTGIYTGNPISITRSLNLGVRRKLNNTFYADALWMFSKQDSDFAKESYRNGRYQVKVTGYW